MGNWASWDPSAKASLQTDEGGLGDPQEAMLSRSHFMLPGSYLKVGRRAVERVSPSLGKKMINLKVGPVERPPVARR